MADDLRRDQSSPDADDLDAWGQDFDEEESDTGVEDHPGEIRAQSLLAGGLQPSTTDEMWNIDSSELSIDIDMDESVAAVAALEAPAPEPPPAVSSFDAAPPEAQRTAITTMPPAELAPEPIEPAPAPQAEPAPEERSRSGRVTEGAPEVRERRASQAVAAASAPSEPPPRAEPAREERRPSRETASRETTASQTSRRPPTMAVELDVLPHDGPLPEGENTWLTSYKIFQSVAQKLARVGGWKKLAAITGNALMHSPFAVAETRKSLLLDLAKIYRDRLKDTRRAEQAFVELAKIDPADKQTLRYLAERFESKRAWSEMYHLYAGAVDETWDPNDRLSWTRRAADIAQQQLKQVDLAIKAWERLWHLGDAMDDASRELTRLYRLTGRWSEMAAFLRERADRLEGPAQLVALRELAEVKLSGEQAADEASRVLEQIVERSPQDPIATLQLARVYAQRSDWDALERLGKQAANDGAVPAEAALDLQQLVADKLWRADRLEQAVAAYNRILDVDPSNHDGTTRKREYLTRTGKWDELLSLLVAKADSVADDDQRGALLAEAAEIAEEHEKNAEHAVKLWERRISIDAEHLGSFEALARLYEKLGDLRGVARALEGQLNLIKEPRRRIDLLRALGDHYARRMGDDERAEACWKEILALDPSDLLVREELTQLHRRRGDFESLNSALMRQIWLTDDVERAQKLCRLAAENLDENFKEPERSVEAWRRVLDFAPLDKQALSALAGHYSSLENRRELIATLEQQIRAVDDVGERVALALQIADIWRALEVPKAAAATYERILRWEPTNQQALGQLVDIYAGADQAGKAAGALDHASVLVVDSKRRIDLLRRCLALVPDKEHIKRFFLLRRVLFLGDGDWAVLAELQAEAQQDAKLWPEHAAVLIQLCCQAKDDDERLEVLEQLAKVCEEHLEDAPRGYLALQSALLAPDQASKVLSQLERLAEPTKRFEDLLAVLDRLTTAEFKIGERKKVLRRRAAICEKKLEAPLRAFHEVRRIVELDPVDSDALAELERLAGAHYLWNELDAVLAQLWDRTTSNKDRIALLDRREHVARKKLKQQQLAFDMLVRRFRLAPEDLDLLKALTGDAEGLKGWDWLLPVLEAAQLAPQERRSADELAVTAALYEDKLGDLDRAFVLYSEAFVMNPSAVDLADKLDSLAGKIDRYEALASTLRMAAAGSDDHEQTLSLLRRIAEIYEQKLNQPQRAIDIHRRLLALKQDEVRSLEVMIAWHRERNEWRDLRDRLHQWVHLAPEEGNRIPRLLEIASISEQHLGDPEGALEAYGTVLELDAEQTDARTGLEGLVLSITEPSLRLRWLRMELKAADQAKRTALRLEIAEIQRRDVEDSAGAIATLRELVQETGADGPGFEPLARLLRAEKRHKDLVLVLRDRARAAEPRDEKLESLDEALLVCHEHFAEREPELREELYRFVLELRPQDRAVRVRLSRLLRSAGRFDDLCKLLDEQMDNLDEHDKIDSLYEMARICQLNLDDSERAQGYWKRIIDGHPQHKEGALLAMARLARHAGDMVKYVDLRHQQAKGLSPTESALVLCHLAEVCDETPELNDKMVPFYREARGVDPDNQPAMEALKGIGRRRKSLRPAAALLPMEGERELEPAERAKRLKALGDGSAESDVPQAISWYQRAVAIDPDGAEAWEALAAACERAADPEGLYRAGRSWVMAVERTSKIDHEALKDEADRLYLLALGAQSANHPDVYARAVQRAYELTPNHAPAALARAEKLIESNNIEQAHELLDEILSHYKDDLADEQRFTAHYARGVTLRRLERRDEAIDDFREALHIEPLGADCLEAIGDAQAEAGRVAAALEYLIRALTVVENEADRANLYYRIGVLWEDGIGRAEEAGACYEQALSDGLPEDDPRHRDLLHRALRHYQRTGRLDESDAVVDGLLPTAEDADELATLWQVRGEIFAARDGGEDEAIEAFDMALSYDPSRQPARDGLVEVLERREDWQQVLQVLEASCDSGTPEQRSESLRRMALICSAKLGDRERCEQYLRQSVDALPTREALSQLDEMYGNDPSRREERVDVLGLLVAFGPPWFTRTLELAKLLLADNKRWAWTMMSPLLGVSQVEPDIKAVVQAMRKEYERPPMYCPRPEDFQMLMHRDAIDALAGVLAQLETMVRPLGTTSVEDAGDGAAIAISPQTSLGKAFSAVASQLGFDDVTLHRTQDLPESVVVVNSDPAAVVVRTEVMQQLVHAEVGFLFAYALALIRPGHRALAALPLDAREQLVPALWRALGFSSDAGKQVTRLSDRIREAVDEGTRAAWAEQLEQWADVSPLELGRRYWLGVRKSARRAGLLAGADLRQAFRVVSRLETDVTRPRVVARIEELDEYVDSSPILQDLVAFAASPSFGKLMANAQTANV
ncbi:MAG: hypothetical protein KC503_45605 [Myxococcales bacterium]|nr:hypothetical protein [Myxococcales bacterium]